MTEQVLKVLGKLDERNTRSIIWVTLEQAKLIIYLALLVKHHKCFQFPYFVNNMRTLLPFVATSVALQSNNKSLF